MGRSAMTQVYRLLPTVPEDMHGDLILEHR